MPKSKHRRKKPAPGAIAPGPAAVSVALPQRRIMIAIPTGSGNPEYTNNLTMNRAIMEASERGWKVDLMYRAWDSMITRARDVLFSQFVASDCTDMFFLDDDLGARPGSFARLMSHDVDLVGGAYRGRRDLEEYVIRALDGHLQIDKSNGLMEVEAVATGFMRITRKAAEAMVAVDPDAWYYDSTAPAGMKVYSIFDNHFDRANRQKWSEDYWFCKKYRDIGGRVWIDPFLTLDHTGKKTFTGNLLEYLKRTNPDAGQPPPMMSLTEAARAMAASTEKEPAGAV